jgi:hypothetical protein
LFLKNFLIPLHIVHSFSENNNKITIYLHTNQNLRFGIKIFNSKSRKTGVSLRYLNFLRKSSTDVVRDFYFLKTNKYGILSLEDCCLKNCSGEIFLVIFFRDTRLCS